MKSNLQIRRIKLRVILVVIFSTLVVLLRLSITGSPFDKVWAEDGTVFYNDAILHGVHSLLFRYSGYPSVLPRFLALLGTFLPPISFGVYCVLISAFVTGISSGYVLNRASKLGMQTTPAFFCASIICLAPSLRIESLGNLANLPWVLIYATWWSLLTFDTTDSSTSKVISRILLLLSLLSSPVTALILPTLYLQNKSFYKNTGNLITCIFGFMFLALDSLFGHQSAPGVTRNNGFSFQTLKELVWGASGNLSLSSGVCLVVAIIYVSFVAFYFVKTPNSSAKVSMMFGLVLILILSYITGWVCARYVGFGSFFIVCGILLGYEQNSVLVKKMLVTLLTIFIGLGFLASESRLSGPSWVAQIRSSHLMICEDNTKVFRMYVSPLISRNNKVSPWGSFVMPCPKTR